MYIYIYIHIYIYTYVCIHTYKQRTMASRALRGPGKTRGLRSPCVFFYNDYITGSIIIVGLLLISGSIIITTYYYY